MFTGNFGTPSGTPNSPLGGRARPSTFKHGGKVLKSGMAHVEKDEVITPAPDKQTRTSSVLDTHEDIVLELTAHGICAPPQGKYIMIPTHCEPDGDEEDIADGGKDMDDPDNQGV
jgi:hypothetical protein